MQAPDNILKNQNLLKNIVIVLMQAPDNMPLYVTVAATFLYFVIPFTIVLFLYLRWLYFYILSLIVIFYSDIILNSL